MFLFIFQRFGPTPLDFGPGVRVFAIHHVVFWLYTSSATSSLLSAQVFLGQRSDKELLSKKRILSAAFNCRSLLIVAVWYFSQGVMN